MPARGSRTALKSIIKPITCSWKPQKGVQHIIYEFVFASLDETCVELLLQARSDEAFLTTKNGGGLTALDCARIKGDTIIQARLELAWDTSCALATAAALDAQAPAAGRASKVRL